MATRKIIILDKYFVLYEEINKIHSLKNIPIFPTEQEIRKKCSSFVLLIKTLFTLDKEKNYCRFTRLLNKHDIFIPDKDKFNEIFDLVNDFIVWLLTLS